MDEIEKLAKAVLEKWWGRREVELQVKTLLDSRGDTLSDEFVLKELRAINESGHAWRKAKADNR